MNFFYNDIILEISKYLNRNDLLHLISINKYFYKFKYLFFDKYYVKHQKNDDFLKAKYIRNVETTKIYGHVLGIKFNDEIIKGWLS